MTTRDLPNQRPDLVGAMLHLPPGQWWTDDGWLHMEIRHIGTPARTRPLPDGWVWALGILHLDGHEIDTCQVPVRVDALPAPQQV